MVAVSHQIVSANRGSALPEDGEPAMQAGDGRGDARRTMTLALGGDAPSSDQRRPVMTAVIGLNESSHW